MSLCIGYLTESIGSEESFVSVDIVLSENKGEENFSRASSTHTVRLFLNKNINDYPQIEKNSAS
jgi:hypothetical protein